MNLLLLLLLMLRLISLFSSSSCDTGSDASFANRVTRFCDQIQCDFAKKSGHSLPSSAVMSSLMAVAVVFLNLCDQIR